MEPTGTTAIASQVCNIPGNDAASITYRASLEYIRRLGYEELCEFGCMLDEMLESLKPKFKLEIQSPAKLDRFSVMNKDVSDVSSIDVLEANQLRTYVTCTFILLDGSILNTIMHFIAESKAFMESTGIESTVRRWPKGTMEYDESLDEIIGSIMESIFNAGDCPENDPVLIVDYEDISMSNAYKTYRDIESAYAIVLARLSTLRRRVYAMHDADTYSVDLEEIAYTVNQCVRDLHRVVTYTRDCTNVVQELYQNMRHGKKDYAPEYSYPYNPVCVCKDEIAEKGDEEK